MSRTEVRSIFVRWVINALALYVAVSVVPGLRFDQGPGRFMIVAALFGLINTLLRPILTLLTCPLVLFTLGLFTLVINAFLLLLTGWLSGHWGLGFRVAGFWPAFWGGLLIGVVSVILSLLVGERQVTVIRQDIE